MYFIHWVIVTLWDEVFCREVEEGKKIWQSANGNITQEREVIPKKKGGVLGFL